jgi:gliding motility-associated-like protein
MKKFLLFILFVSFSLTGIAAVPVISSFTPSSGSVGTLVTITGTDLSSPTALNIGGKAAIVISNTGTTLVAMVMPGAVTGNVTLTNTDGTTTGSGSFTLLFTSAPTAQQGNKLEASDNAGNAAQGSAVAISADGNTAIVGGYADNNAQGAAWIYTRSGNTWSQQGNKLTASDNTGTITRQGWAVAISADGNTAMVGGFADDDYVGAAWVYTRTGGVWTQQGAKLVSSDHIGLSYQGNSVSLSADGNTAILGGPLDNFSNGAAWIYTRTGNTWTQQGNKLIATNSIGAAHFGFAVSLSGDGNTAIIGGDRDNTNKGAVWIYTRTGGVWTQQGNKLVGSGGFGNGQQGSAVSLSADGNTAIESALYDSTGKGAVWIYSRNAGVWTQQGFKLVGTGGSESTFQGAGVSLSADGNTAIVGGSTDNASQGATWVYTRSNGVWLQLGTKLVGTGAVLYANQGTAVSLSADGNTTIVGGNADNGSVGAAWVFKYVPTNANLAALGVSAGIVSPVFESATIAYTDSIGYVESPFTITPRPADANARITVQVNNNGYNPLSGPLSLNVGINTIDIKVTAVDGVTTKTYTLTVTRSAPPAITSFSPSFASVGSLITISGTDLFNPTAVSIGGISAVIVSATPTTVVAMLMPGAATGNVSLSTTDGTTVAGSFFTVIPSPAPNTQQGSKLSGIGNAGANEGRALALSADGNTAVMGAPLDNSNLGAAWIYTRSGGVWSQQDKLVGTNYILNSNQGYSVGISADGNTVIVGGNNDNNSIGAAWIYVRNGAVWSQQSKLVGTANIGKSNQGSAVSLSADGNTAIVGGSMDNTGIGAVWVFTRQGNTWTQMGNKLKATDNTGAAHQGVAVSLSADGKTMLVGGNYDNATKGAAWVFTRNGNTWTQQGNKLVGTGGNAYTFQGFSVSLSADASTAIIGGYLDDPYGSAWVFTRNGTTWSQQGDKLAPTLSVFTAFGYSVALSSNGNTAMIGGYGDDNGKGAAWMYTRNANTWTLDDKLTGTGNTGIAFQGAAVALSADGNTAMTGGYRDNGSAGAGWIYTYLSRNANLSALTISAGTLTPVFNKDTTSYKDTVNNNINTITITPTQEDINGIISVQVNGGGYTPVVSGTTSSALALSLGDNTIEVKVVAQDNTTIKTYTITVTRKLLDQTITFAAPANKTYGDSDFILTASGGLSGNAITYTSSNTGVAVVNGNMVTIVAAGITNITASQAGNTNYNAAADVIRSLTVDAKAINVTAGPKNKIYGDADPALTYTHTPALIGSDAFSGELDRVLGEDAGTYTINKNTLALSSNYVLNYTGADFTINAKTVSVSVDAQHKVYGDTDPALTYTYTPALITGDVFTGELNRVAGEDAGAYTINKNTLALSSNYVLNYTGADLIIGVKAIALSVDAQHKVYGDTDPALTYTYTPALITGDVFTGELNRVAGEDAGAYTIDKNTLALSSNYVLNYTGADLIIGVKAIAVSVDAQHKVYGDTDPVLTYTYTPALITGDVFTGELDRVSGEDAGSYTINKNTLALSTNYTLNYTAADLIISKKSLTISADNKSKAYGDANPVLSESYTGFAGSDDKTVLATPVVLSTSAGISSPTGPYPINISGATALNYTISFVDGILTIKDKTQIIDFPALADKLSTDAVFTLTATATSGLTVSYTSSDPDVARIVNDNQVEMLKAGTVLITASQDGNTNYLAATPVIQQLIIIDNPLPVISIESDKGNRISKGETVQLKASGAATYEWLGGGQNSSVLIVRPSVTTTYTVTGANQYGRTATQTFTLEVRNDLQATGATNILTPNGDGINDYWIVQNIDMYPENEVKIFDRSGRVVYTKKGYNNNWGATLNGMPLAEGTYYYVIDFGNEAGIKKGFITIVRK